jgi:carbon-monoxide dehydrogenase small subunit
MRNKIAFYLNNKFIELEIQPTKRLLDVLREDCGLTGLKEGCGEGECGACSALVDGELVNTCIYPIGNAVNKNIVTIELSCH